MPPKPRFPADVERREADARRKAEAAFRKATAKPVGSPEARATLPGARELVSLRIDQDVLEHFQADGPGWQDRINAALKEHVDQHS